MEKCARVVIFHRNRLMGECLAAALSHSGKYLAEFLPGAADRRESVDVAVIDLSLGALALEMAQRYRNQQPDGAKILLLAPSMSYELIAPPIAAGAQGCIMEEASLRELENAVERICAGEYFCSPQFIAEMFSKISDFSRQNPPQPQWRSRLDSADLTHREFEIVCLVADGCSNKQIARRLCLSLYTVKNHVHNILQKLQVTDRFQAVDHVRERGWLAKEPGRAK